MIAISDFTWFSRTARGAAAAAGLAALLGLLVAPLQAADVVQWSEGQQLVRVLSADWDATSAQLHRFERTGDAWTEVGEPMAVSIGRSGSAWGLGLSPPQEGEQKREGDGRSPAGLFAIGTAFGYAMSAEYGLDYLPLKAAHYCIDDPESWLYTQIVDTRDVGALAVSSSTEPMRRDVHLNGDQAYRLGFVVNHNEKAISGAGSCIFAHLWRGEGEPTAGCTAMSEASMTALLDWLDAVREPRFLLLPREVYLKLEQEWGLPAAPEIEEAVPTDAPDS